MYLSHSDIRNTTRIKRLNIINSITGIKPANLVATRSRDGRTNVGIFSSVVHLGSNPPLLGFIFRPQHEKPRDTYINIKETGYYTINQVPAALVENAHYTSAKFPTEISEFERCGFTEEYRYGFEVPFVKESQIKIGLEMVEEILIPSNMTILMVGQILHLQFPDECMDTEGNLDLDQIQTAGISGVNTYYRSEKIARFPYAHLADVPDFHAPERD
jgi:flavin reductase (DIM6/NTAB) family NADH-FMN oxidoreductase RutF